MNLWDLFKPVAQAIGQLLSPAALPASPSHKAKPRPPRRKARPQANSRQPSLFAAAAQLEQSRARRRKAQRSDPAAVAAPSTLPAPGQQLLESPPPPQRTLTITVLPISLPAPSPATANNAAPNSATRPAALPSGPMQDRYDEVARAMLAEYQVSVRRWRSAMSGIAWELKYKDGRIKRMIESPRPKGPMSAAVFLHEIGHHAIGFHRYAPRCLEEFKAWEWSLAAMGRNNLNITDAVRYRMALSLWYAVDKARRRGLKQLPIELAPYQTRPPSPTKPLRDN